MSRVSGMPTIRAATADDALSIARVHVEAWRTAYAGLIPDAVLVGLSEGRQAMQWARTLGSDRAAETVWVADGADGVVGFVSCGRARAAPLPNAGEIYSLYVAPDHQNAGAGRDLLTASHRALAEAGMVAVVVWVLTRNPARFFYEAMGAKRFGERIETMWGTALDETGYAWAEPLA